MPSDCILIYSGGLDSTVLLYELLSLGRNPHCLTFNYGQRHRREINCARSTCGELGIPFSLVDLTSITRLIASGSQTGREPVPEGRYDGENMKSTIVPNRNMIMLSIAVGAAVSSKLDEVYFGAHAGDHPIYPDCRPQFVDMMRQVCQVANGVFIHIQAPFGGLSKAQIVKRGIDHHVPFEHTWSCYVGMARPCGRCGTCVERLEAFAANWMDDPLEYEDRTFWKEAINASTPKAPNEPK